jgi:hypothetical protein
MTQQSIVDFARDALGVTPYPGQAAALMGYYASGRPNYLLLAGRRGGKSLLSDIIACYEAVVPDFGAALRPGETRHVIIVSVRLDNAALHIRNCGKLLRHTKGLGKLIKLEKQDRLELANGVTILSLPASARAGRGFTASAVILDELAHFQDTLGNASADAVYDAFTPCVATFGDRGRIIVTTTPAARQGIVFDLFDRELEDWHITRKTTQELNPKVSDKTIDRARLRDAESASVEYDAEFSDPVASFLSSDAIDRAVDRGRQPAESGEAGVTYVMAIDPATMGDRYAFVITHHTEGKVILDYAHIIKPPVDPNAAEDLLFDLARRFKPTKIRCDTAATTERLKDKLPHLEYTPFSRPMKLRIYGSLKEALNMGGLVLYPDGDLIAELKALQIRNGVDICAPKSGRITHDDLADCLALCCDAMVSGGHTWIGLTTIGGPIADRPSIAYHRIDHDPGARRPMTNTEWERASEASRQLAGGALSRQYKRQQDRLRFGSF